MASITISSPTLQNDGPVLEVEILLSKDYENTYKQANKPIPAPVKVNALVDTGASGCVIRKDIPEKLGVRPIGTARVSTSATIGHEAYVYWLRLIIRTESETITYTGQFTALPLERQNISVLIGRDFLRHGIFVYTGTANQFTLSLS